jgi:hypothetical protein
MVWHSNNGAESVKLPNTEHNRNAIKRIAEALNLQGLARGLAGQSDESIAELCEQLADSEIYLDILEDHEGRMGFDVTNARAELCVLHCRAEGEPTVPTTQDWLTETFIAWRTLNNLPHMCASDMAHEHRRGRLAMSEAQYEWLREFSRLWDSAD